VFFAEVRRRLCCAVVLPDHAEVANAVGAAVGDGQGARGR
jgi:hypothetical protein